MFFTCAVVAVAANVVAVVVFVVVVAVVAIAAVVVAFVVVAVAAVAFSLFFTYAVEQRCNSVIIQLSSLSHFNYVQCYNHEQNRY